MDLTSAVLEYWLAEHGGSPTAKWQFRLKTPDGQTLMQSAKAFDSLALAEQAFVAMIKLIATNQYRIDAPGLRNAERIAAGKRHRLASGHSSPPKRPDGSR